jgi:hypothetical protein
MTTYPSELAKLLDEIEARHIPTPAPPPVYECDCGARYRSLDSLWACQSTNHGRK